MKHVILITSLLAIAAAPVMAQQSRTIRGKVRLATGEPISGANVFVLETLDGTLSDDAGAFALTTKSAAGTTLIVQHLGLREHRERLTALDTLTIVMGPDVFLVPALNVVAGRFATGSAPDAQLNAIQVVSTPGASADVYRALQTFPGLQAVNEGAGLFVRGGDVAETRVFLNEATVLSPYRHESPTGGFFGAFDPFLLDGIFFSSGGFGARYGDALSGIAALRTLGRPDRLTVSATASLAALSGTASVPVGSALGARGTLTRSNTHLMFRVNGTTTEFTHEPEGRDASLTAAFQYGKGEVRLFAIDQWSELGVFLTEASFEGALENAAVHRSQVLSWEHHAGNARFTVVGSNAGSDRSVTFGAFELDVGDHLRQLRAIAELHVTPLLGLTAGAEFATRKADFTGRTPSDDHDGGMGAPTHEIGASIDDTHRAAFIEADWSARDRVRAIIGLRADRSRLSGETTFDPRVSLAFRVVQDATITAAWGLYHQVPDPGLHDEDFGGSDIGAMRAEHRILGFQLGESAGAALLFRAEAYDKQYRDLAAFDRDRRVHDNGTGSSRGLDIFVRWPELLGFGGRTSYSYIDAKRTDPSSGLLARSPFDITQVLTSVIDRRLGAGWSASVAHRYASGRPFTPVVSAQRDARRNVWVPTYGAPNSQRLPAFHRIDVSLSRLVPLPHDRMLVIFTAANNILDRKNVYDYRYNADYSQRTEERSQFKRSVYFGATLNW